MEIKKRWPASSLLVQHETERLNDGCLASIVLSKQNIHARPEIDCLVGKATEIADTNLCQEHIVPKGTTGPIKNCSANMPEQLYLSLNVIDTIVNYLALLSMRGQTSIRNSCAKTPLLRAF